MPSYGLVSAGLQWYHKWYTSLHVADGQSKEMTRDSYFNKRQITIILIVIIRVVIITRFCHENLDALIATEKRKKKSPT